MMQEIPLKMDNKLLESYLDNIGELVVEEDKIVTYKSLSRNLGIHVNTAKQLLYTYLTKQKTEKSFPISATYLLAGKLPDGSFNITVVNEEDLKSTYSKFVEVTSEHVYSIQKGKTVKDLKLLCSIESGLENIESYKPVIQCSKSIPRSRGKLEKKSDIRTDKPVEEEIKPKKAVECQQVKKTVSPTKSPIKKAFENAAKSPKKSSPPENKEKINQDKKQANVKTKKTGGNIANFFNNAAQKNKATSNITLKNKNENQIEVEKSQKITSPEKKPSHKEVIKEKKEENNLKPAKKGTSNEKSKKKKDNNKRKRIHVFSDSEESEDNDDSDKEPVEVEEENSEPVSTPVEILEEEKEKINDTIGRNKKRRRKLVDKTVMNDDGYLETRKEVVFETDSEEDSVEKKDNSRKDENQQKKIKLEENNGKSKGVAGNPGKKQASLLNFFKKN